MGSPSSPVKVATAVLSALFLTAAVWVLRGYVWPTLSSVEVATLQAKLDPALFTHDFVVQECLRFTPRFYFNAVLLSLAHLGGSLTGAYAIGHVVALFLLVTGLKALAQELKLGSFAFGALLIWLLVVGVGTVGLTYFYTEAPVPAVWANSGVVWGATWAVRKRWTAAFACFAGTALIQFLVGFYAGVLALPFLLFYGGRSRIPALGLWVAGLALVYVPMRLDGGTETGVLSSADFVWIYAYLRHPHHLVASTWGWLAWIQAGAFYFGAVYFLHRTAAAEAKLERTVLYVTLALTGAALAANYVFVELLPVALIAKLQLARITPLAQGVVFALLARRIQSRIEAADYVGAVLLVLIPFTAAPGFLLMLAGIFFSGTPSQSPLRVVVLIAGVALAFQPFDPSFPSRGLHYAMWAVLFGSVLFAGWLSLRPRWLAGATVVACFATGYAAHASLKAPLPLLASHFTLNAQPWEPAGVLGQRFQATSPKDAVVLAPLGDYIWAFKLFSQRALVVDEKNFPFTERGMVEWRHRMERVLGRPMVPGLDLEAAWRDRSPEALAALAEDYGAHYILTRDDWHPNFPGRRIDHERGWSLWQLR